MKNLFQVTCVMVVLLNQSLERSEFLRCQQFSVGLRKNLQGWFPSQGISYRNRQRRS